ncbi:MAG: Cytidylate kinase [Hyphomicrobiaceae bacterium hypho_1]
MLIAIDGPAASGKGTIARQIAKHYGFAYLDTGLLYRAVARDVKKIGGSLEQESDAVKAALSLNLDTLSDPTLRLTDIATAASIIGSHSELRKLLSETQNRFVEQHINTGAVLDGRDIGTVVCPNADVKLYITADINIRAKRRYLELIRNGENIKLNDVLTYMQERDDRDYNRKQSPLHPAQYALLLDTSNLGIVKSFEAANELIKRKISQQNA